MGKMKDLKKMLENADQIYLSEMEKAIDGYRAKLIKKMQELQNTALLRRLPENKEQIYYFVKGIAACIDLVSFKKEAN
jgi:hypothetical protein